METLSTQFELLNVKYLTSLSATHTLIWSNMQSQIDTNSTLPSLLSNLRTSYALGL